MTSISSSRPAINRALFVTPWLPTETDWTATAGIARRQRLLVDALKQCASSIDVLVYVSQKRFDGSEAMCARIERELNAFWEGDFNVSVCRWQEAPPRPGLWAHYGAPVLDFTRHAHFGKCAGPAQVAALRQALSRGPDLVVAHRLQCAVPLLLAGAALPPFLLDLDDVEHVAFARGIRQPPMWVGKYLEYLQIPALMAGERRAIAASRKTLVCSEVDRRRLERLFRVDNVEAIPNAVASRAATAPSGSPTLLLLGHYSFTPNRLGAEYFLNSVWPLVRQALPGARVVIAGAGPQAIRHALDGDHGVSFPGYVDDLDLLYAGCCAVICPILSGGGTRLKVMEAASYARAVVSTTVGAEGIDLRDGDEIFLADDAAAFADRCVALLTDAALARDVGARARDAIERLYGRDRVVQRLASLFAGRAT